MFEKLVFYLRHSFNDLRVNGQRTLFALLCIATGVAAIVSLQTLGVMIENSLTTSLQESNGGDIKLLPVEDGNFSAEAVARGREEGVLMSQSGMVMGGHADEEASYYFSPAGFEQLQTWFADEFPGSELTYRQTMTGGHGPFAMASVSNLQTEVEQMFVSPYIIDAAVYPLYGERESEQGAPLSDLLQNPTDIVISRNLADTLGAEVGDMLRVNGATTDFVLRGIVPLDAESGLENIGGSLFGYFYLDMSAADLFNADALGIDQIYVRLPNPEDELSSAELLFAERYDYLGSTTTTDLADQNTEISDNLNQLVTIMGLVSLLIGGIGIVNTMQVVVSRRTNEIAVLKTIGLEGEQVTALFMVEAILMGIVGSLLGIVLGWLAAYGIKGVAETFISQSLTFQITLAPPLTGLIVGVLVTTVFGFMPTLAAGQVRPNLVLRPSDAVMPRAGRVRSLAALIAVIAALSLVAQPLVGGLFSSSTFGLIGGIAGAILGLGLGALIGLLSTRSNRNRVIAALAGLVAGFGFGYIAPALLLITGTFMVVGILYVVLWALIWLVGRFFPALGIVDMKVALRAMIATRGRGASTLLALVIGVFTLSLITMLTTAISNRFEEMLVNETGGNVIIFADGEADTLDTIENRLTEIEGVNSFSVLGSYTVELVSLEDAVTGEIVPYDELQARVDENSDAPEIGPGHRQQLGMFMTAIDARSVDSNLPEVNFYSGRQLNAADAGQPRIVISANDTTLAAGMKTGDWLTFRFVGANGTVEMAFEIVGMVDRTGSMMQMGVTASNYAPVDAFPAELAPDSVSAIVDIDAAQIKTLRRSMNEVPGVFMMETRHLNDVVNRIIDQFTSFPMLVASLSLIVGGIVIANSVALSTLERRREIGIMKAIGLQRERVLNMLLIENGLMGFIGGLIGVGLGSVILLALMVGVFGGNLGNAIPYMTAFSLMGLCVLIALIAAIITVWGASGEKPLNVLRYE